MAVELIPRGLPKPWSFAVTRDGRIFFVNDESRTTTWLHPVTAEPVCTGNVTLPDLPAGWERSVNLDCVPFYIDHNRKETTFVHPITQLSSIQYGPPKSVSQQPYLNSSSANSNSIYNTSSELRKSQKKKGQHIRSPVIKRDSRSTVTMEGWLYKLEGGALKQWRKRWFVLADFCLFVYKGPDEEKVLGSILLPSYKINPCTSEDKTSRKFAFKAEHHNMKTYYFAADSKESMGQWMNVMSLASIMQKSLSPGICGGSANPKVSFSNDDEDSGFTSYKSRRYGSTQDPNSTLNSSFASEQLNLQYSYRDVSRDNFSDSSHITGRSSENEYLGSGDKYPGHYGSSLSRAYSASPRESEVSTKGRQPLYANAPPKPKRTGQKDPYAIAPNERYDTARLEYTEEIYDERGHKHTPKLSSRQNYDISCPRLYNEQNKEYFTTEHHAKLANDSVKQVKPVNSDNSYARNTHKQQHQHKDATPLRPHSADFLEHDSYNDPFNAPVIYRHKSSSRNKANQPPRPKSSLERYDPHKYSDNDAWMRQEKDYWYREQVSSPLPMHCHADNSFEQQSVGYYSSHNISTDDHHYKISINEQHRRNSDISTDRQKQYTGTPFTKDSQNPKSSRIRDRPASTGCQLEDSSILVDGADDSKNHQREVSMKRLLEWKQRMLQSPLARKYPQRTSGGQYEDNSIPPPRPPLPEEYQQRVLQELENHEAQLRLREMQCKEKSYDEPSVTNAEIHSDRGQLKQINDKNDSTMLLQHISKKEGEKDERNACSPSRSQDHRRPSSSLGRLNSSYSSDEEEDKTKDCKRTRRQSQICRPKRSSIDKSSTNRNTVMKTNVSPSPDYVNITMLNDIHGKATCDAFTSSSKMKSIPAEEDLRNLASSKENLKMETYANETQDSNLYSTKYFASPDSVDTSFASNDGEENDEKEDFYIRKEDYYKASQLFYAKPQGSKRDKPSVKNTESSDQLGSICINENAKTDKSSTNLSKTQKSEETYDSRYWSNAERRSRTNWQLDKDVGLPLPPYPGSARMKDARQKKMQLRSNSLPSVQQQDLPEDVLRSDKSEHMPKPKKVSPDIANSGEKNPRTENILFHTSSIRHMEEKAKSIELPSTPSKSCSFEEMRTFLQRQKEAPPPNIVQSRIKHFEQTSPSVQTPGEIRKRLSGNDKPTKEQASKNVIASKSETEITFEDSVNQVIDETKISVHRRQLCSDSETVFHNDSTNDNESNDDILTIKSAPIVLSPLSSVLADLRRTADTGREKTKTNKDESSIDEIIITKGALRLSMVEDQTLTELDEPCKVEEEVYLPMKGKNAEEAVYVAMSDSKESLLASHSITKEQLEKPPLTEDEPLYNEPISPPPSFLHDVYGKHKSRHSHFQFESSSSGHSSENIYEKPNYFDDLSTNSCIKNRSFKSMYSENRPISSYVKISKEQENDFEIKTDSMDKGENFPVTLTYTAGSLVSEKTLEQDEFIDCDIPSQLNDSIPDLLQVKDSDASDADDEASRDFDTPKNLSLPPYQTAILLGEQSSIDDHASIDDDHNLQTVFPFKSSNHCQPLKMLELSNNNFHRTLKKESEIENRNMEQDSLFELSSSLPNYQTLNEEQRFTEFLYDMIPLKAMESHQSGNYLHCKEENESQLRVANENKKLGRKTSLPVIINRKIIEGNLEKSEQRICDLPNISKLSKVSKSENEVQNVGLNTNSEITSSFSKATTAIEAKTISLCDVKADYSMNTTSYSSLAPDVVPADDRDEISHNAKISSKTNRSPSSAPYYYSDLLTETDGSKLGRLPVIDKFCVSRSNHNVLNNVRDVSPSNSNKSDVGRKVNKICENNRILSPNRFSSSESFTNSMQFSLSSDITQMAEQDIRSSLQHLLIPESTKFRDAEKNKYEAGHTLEKTRSTASTLQRLKKRAATPDFSRNHEHHYENLDSTWAVTVKRLSRSLEELLDTDEGLQNQNCWHSHQFSLEKNEEPFYENIGFSALKSETCNSFDDAAKDRDLIASPQTAPAKHTVFDNDQLNYSNNIKTPNHFNQIKHTESKQDLTDARSPLDSYSDNHDSDGYLDQNILRSASKRHFLARFTNEKYVSQLTRNQTSSDSIASSTGPDCFLAESRRSNDGSGEVSDRGREKKSEGIEVSNLEGLSSTYRQKSHYKLVEKPISKAQNNLGHHSLREHDFFDSSSDSSASLRPENEGIAHQKKHYTSNSKADTCKNKTGVFRMSKEDPNMSDSEIHVRTPSRLKKLVHQSEGLTSRGKRLSISAGDLLGKTHEELVLLLIQLRRNQSCIAKKRQQCHIQLESEIYLNERESSREEHMKKCEEINHQMLELVKQYEMTQPLINLVDNMVKLGSLYGPERKTTNSHMESVSENISLPCMQLLELSKQLRNRQLTCKGGSASKTFNEDSLEERLQQLYHLDRTLHDEFLNFTSLQQDREILETTLEGVRKKVSEFRDNAVDMGRLYKQQRMIEKELSKVIRLLMQSIQKLERVVGENSSLEQEIVCLKQQIHQFLQCNKDVEGTPQEKAEIETELCRVEQIIEELASHRRNINNTIEKAKVESKHKVLSSEVRASPTGVAGSVPLPIRKKHQSSYMETDLDTMECKDLSGHGVSTMELDGNDIPLYANAGEIGSPTQEFGPDGTLLSTSVQLPLDDNYDPQDINEADDRMKMFYGIIPKDKPSEIKTVRIVKRESERRNRVRDKKKVTYDDNSLVWVVEEPEIFLYEEDEVEEEVERLRQTLLLPGLYNRPTSLFTPQQEMALSAHERLFGPTSVFTGIEEGKLNSDRDMASDSLSPTRRPKRRHYTISGFSYNPLFKGGLRSCDDVDMERCLRTANTPDIVRSTIKKSDVFDDKIIDRELGLPQKINIPERYIESEPEQLSATERLKRSLKAETIRRMLSETTTYEDVADKQEPTDLLKKKVDEEKKRRAHLLALNHALAREVMERSKIVAANVTSPESPYSLP